MDVDIPVTIILYVFLAVLGLAIISFIALKVSDYLKKRRALKETEDKEQHEKKD